MLKKGLLEPWPCHFSEKPKWNKVEKFSRWKEPKSKDNSETQLMLHLTGMKNTNSLRSTLECLVGSNLSLMETLEVVRNWISVVFVSVERGIDNFALLDNMNQPLWFIRAHLPVKVSPFGSPIIMLSALDLNLSQKLIKKGHIQAKQAQEDFNRIFDHKRQKELFPTEVTSEDSAHLLRYVLRLNSTRMTPSTWQEENLPLGKYSPYLATFITPLYLDNAFPENDEEVESNKQKIRNIRKDLGIPSSSYCAACAKSSHGQLKRCSGCKTRFYCSVECQRNDWQKHKPVCHPCSCCIGCGEASKKLKYCSRCKIARYCSSKCQKDNWHQHKLICGLMG